MKITREQAVKILPKRDAIRTLMLFVDGNGIEEYCDRWEILDIIGSRDCLELTGQYGIEGMELKICYNGAGEEDFLLVEVDTEKRKMEFPKGKLKARAE